MLEFWDGSDISWTICKRSASSCRQITTPTPHHSMFVGQMLFLMPNEQRHSTEGKSEGSYVALKRRVRLMLVQELLSVYE